MSNNASKNSDLSIEEILDRVSFVGNCKNDAQIALVLGASRSMPTTWRNRKNVPFEKLFDFAKKERVLFEWLLTGKGEMRPSFQKLDERNDAIGALVGVKEAKIRDEKRFSEALERIEVSKDGEVVYREVENASSALSDERSEESPKYGVMLVEHIHYLDVKAAINGIIRADESMGTLPFKKELLEKMSLTKADVYYTVPESDAMSPTILNDGVDTLLIEPNNKVIKDTSIYAIVVGDEMIHRRLHKTVDGGIKITSDNSLYPDIDLSKEQASELHIIGRVRFKSRFDEM